MPSFGSLAKSFPELGGYLILLVIATCGVTKKKKGNAEDMNWEIAKVLFKLGKY